MGKLSNSSETRATELSAVPLLNRRQWLAAALLSPLGATLPAPAAGEPNCPASVREVLQPFSKLVGLKVEFVEEKRILLLKKPLVNRGSVVFMAPGNLVRRIDSPTASAVWIRPGQFWVRDKSGERKLEVARWGPANVLVNSFLYVLRGDVDALNKHYRSALTCQGGAWKLELTPRAPELAKIVRSLRITGQQAAPETLELVDGSGDTSLTRFGKASNQVRYTEAQLKRFFSSPAAKP